MDPGDTSLEHGLHGVVGSNDDLAGAGTDNRASALQGFPPQQLHPSSQHHDQQQHSQKQQQQQQQQQPPQPQQHTSGQTGIAAGSGIQAVSAPAAGTTTAVLAQQIPRTASGDGSSAIAGAGIPDRHGFAPIHMLSQHQQQPQQPQQPHYPNTSTAAQRSPIQYQHQQQQPQATPATGTGGQPHGRTPATASPSSSTAGATPVAAANAPANGGRTKTKVAYRFDVRSDIQMLDRILAKLPFRAGHGHTMRAWASVAESLNDEEFGGRPLVDGAGVKRRFDALLDSFRRGEMDVLRSSGSEAEHDQRNNLIAQIADESSSVTSTPVGRGGSLNHATGSGASPETWALAGLGGDGGAGSPAGIAAGQAVSRSGSAMSIIDPASPASASAGAGTGGGGVQGPSANSTPAAASSSASGRPITAAARSFLEDFTGIFLGSQHGGGTPGDASTPGRMDAEADDASRGPKRQRLLGGAAAPELSFAVSALSSTSSSSSASPTATNEAAIVSAVVARIAAALERRDRREAERVELEREERRLAREQSEVMLRVMTGLASHIGFLSPTADLDDHIQKDPTDAIPGSK
ncbi:hypothetical protein HK405_006721 [Cladochytrium tenue]|nr:hypothetical protein HK405_006721 [Cladochytrium tenue]